MECPLRGCAEIMRRHPRDRKPHPATCSSPKQLTTSAATRYRAEASIAAIAGARTMTLQNDEGVVITIGLETAGPKASVGVGGVEISFESCSG